ncbi:MAG: DUF3592 domain-containing protein [Megasphaera sp.]|jgi:hypothetical protein|nr:DUF3592 domain-containing protein [Megasphaera sp.]MCI1247350.1 DUF3592 domain-containing protein [Megasphaera sp.]
MSVFYYLPAALGILFIVVGTYHGWKLRALTRHCKVAAKGTLLGFEEKKMKSGSLFYPVVQFTAQGTTYKSRYDYGDSEWKIVAGDTVDLRYNAENPQEIYLDHEQSIWQQYASPFFIIVGGLIFIAAYYVVL